MAGVVLKTDHSVRSDLNITFHLEFHMAISYWLADFSGYIYYLGEKSLCLPALLDAGLSVIHIWVNTIPISYPRLHPLLL